MPLAADQDFKTQMITVPACANTPAHVAVFIEGRTKDAVEREIARLMNAPVQQAEFRNPKETVLDTWAAHGYYID